MAGKGSLDFSNGFFFLIVGCEDECNGEEKKKENRSCHLHVVSSLSSLFSLLTKSTLCLFFFFLNARSRHAVVYAFTSCVRMC